MAVRINTCFYFSFKDNYVELVDNKFYKNSKINVKNINLNEDSFNYDKKLPKELYIILIGHVSQIIFQYIQKCNSGIKKDEYDMYEMQEMRDSVEFKELSKRIRNFNQKCKNTKIIDYFIDKYPSEELLKKLKSNTKSYEEMQESLEFVKGKIGYLFYDRSEVYF